MQLLHTQRSSNLVLSLFIVRDDDDASNFINFLLLATSRKGLSVNDDGNLLFLYATMTGGGSLDGFVQHLVAVLSIYDLQGPCPAPVPRYDGPQTWETDSILRSLASMAKRMYSAEGTLKSLRQQQQQQQSDKLGAPATAHAKDGSGWVKVRSSKDVKQTSVPSAANNNRGRLVVDNEQQETDSSPSSPSVVYDRSLSGSTVNGSSTSSSSRSRSSTSANGIPRGRGITTPESASSTDLEISSSGDDDIGADPDADADANPDAESTPVRRISQTGARSFSASRSSSMSLPSSFPSSPERDLVKLGNDSKTGVAQTNGGHAAAAGMAIDLEGLRASLDPAKMFNRSVPLPPGSYPQSAPATSLAEHPAVIMLCPTCGHAIPGANGSSDSLNSTSASNSSGDGFPLTSSVSTAGVASAAAAAAAAAAASGATAQVLPTPDVVGNIFGASPEGSPLVVSPSGPLATAAFESGLSAVEELKLLKTQVQDVSRVCQAVARGDLSQKITVPVQGVVMVQLKDVINTMVGSFEFFRFNFEILI